MCLQPPWPLFFFLLLRRARENTKPQWYRHDGTFPILSMLVDGGGSDIPLDHAQGPNRSSAPPARCPLALPDRPGSPSAGGRPTADLDQDALQLVEGRLSLLHLDEGVHLQGLHPRRPRPGPRPRPAPAAARGYGSSSFITMTSWMASLPR